MTKKVQEGFTAIDSHTKYTKDIAQGWQIINQLVQSANLNTTDLRCVDMALGLTKYLTDRKAKAQQ